MDKSTISIAGLHDGVALSQRQAAGLAKLIEYVIATPAPDSAEVLAGREGLRMVANVLRGLRCDGSNPGTTE
jgi:hypothetical protein